MLGAELEPTEVLTEALRVARESARAADAEHLLDQVTILLEPGQHHRRRRFSAHDGTQHQESSGNR